MENIDYNILFKEHEYRLCEFIIKVFVPELNETREIHLDRFMLKQFIKELIDDTDYED